MQVKRSYLERVIKEEIENVLQCPPNCPKFNAPGAPGYDEAKPVWGMPPPSDSVLGKEMRRQLRQAGLDHRGQELEMWDLKTMVRWCTDLSHLESLYGADTNERLFPLIWKSREITKPTGNAAIGAPSGKPDGGLSWYSSHREYLSCLGARMAPDLDISDFRKNLLSDVKTGQIKPIPGLDIVHHEKAAWQRWRLRK